MRCILFRKRELIEFWGKLGELCEKLGEFQVAFANALIFFSLLLGIFFVELQGFPFF